MSTLDERIAEFEARQKWTCSWEKLRAFTEELVARVRGLEADAHHRLVGTHATLTEFGAQLAERDRTIEELRGAFNAENVCALYHLVPRERLAAAERELELCRSAVREYLDYRAETATPIVADAGPLLWLQICALRSGSEGGER